jgi:GntR family transcriptional regulator
MIQAELDAPEQISQEPYIDPNQVVPLYHQIYLILRQQILDGRYTSTPLPGELALADQFKVSRVTMRRALQDLVNEGLIARGRGKGTFARPLREARPVLPVRLHTASDQAPKQTMDSTIDVLDVVRITPPQDIADLLHLSMREQVQKATRVRIAREQPFAHLTTYVPEHIARNFGRRELQSQSMLFLLEESGVKLGAAKQSISARLADAAVASSLQVPVGAPLLSLTRIVYDTEDQPVKLLRGLYRPDRFDYRMELASSDAYEGRVWVHKESSAANAQVS